MNAITDRSLDYAEQITDTKRQNGIYLNECNHNFMMEQSWISRPNWKIETEFTKDFPKHNNDTLYHFSIPHFGCNREIFAIMVTKLIAKKTIEQEYIFFNNSGKWNHVKTDGQGFFDNVSKDT